MKMDPKTLKHPERTYIGDPVMRGVGDNNRGPFNPAQTSNKVFQTAEETVRNNPGTKITGAVYNSGLSLPFNIGGEYHY